jgi:glycosyltransferase involved in cell wall biosynthesis
MAEQTSLSIAITADPGVPVPPTLYGGIERVIHWLAEGLVARGHHIVLFADAGSRISGTLVPYPTPTGVRVLDVARNAASIASHVMHDGFDVVHSFGRLASLAPLALNRTPKIMSYQRPITPRSIRSARTLFGDTLQFTACSRHMIAPVSGSGTWHVIYNGVPLSAFDFQADVVSDAPLVFLGRVEFIKGTHIAIDVAQRTGRRLIIAGNVAPEHRDYFDRQVKPFVDGRRIEYVGPVDDRAKNILLGQASALLMPILWDEPFGIVMAEALACGTPVVGLRRASVPEVVDDGVTGWLADDADGLVAGVERIEVLNRSACRQMAETRFSDRQIVGRYESLYRSIIGAHKTVAVPQRQV